MGEALAKQVLAVFYPEAVNVQLPSALGVCICIRQSKKSLTTETALQLCGLSLFSASSFSPVLFEVSR